MKLILTTNQGVVLDTVEGITLDELKTAQAHGAEALSILGQLQPGKGDEEDASEDPEPSHWFAEGYSVGYYDTREYELADLPGDEARAEYQRGLTAGQNALTNTKET